MAPMSRLKLVILLVACLAFTSQVDAQATCMRLLGSAQNDWNKAVGINTTLNWNDPVALRSALEGAFANSNDTVGAFKKVCLGHNKYKNYLMQDYSPARCLNAKELIVDSNGRATGVTERQAKTYLSIPIAFDFICGAGYPIFVNNANCLGSQIFGAQRSNIDAVFNSFWGMVGQLNNADGGQITQDSASMYCSLVELASNRDANKNIFNVCGKPEVLYFGCEYFRQSLQYHYSFCTTIDCSQQPS